MSKWNSNGGRCDECGKFIPMNDYLAEPGQPSAALHEMVIPDSDRSSETWITLCRRCNANRREELAADDLKSDRTQRQQG